jgi:hypothetical protein
MEIAGEGRNSETGSLSVFHLANAKSVYLGRDNFAKHGGISPCYWLTETIS